MLSATEDGKGVSYVCLNPESGLVGLDFDHLQPKNVWAARRDGMLFASGWDVEAEEFTKFLVDEAIARFHAEGLEETLAYYNNPDSVDAQWYVLIATPRARYWATRTPRISRRTCKRCSPTGPSRPPRMACG